MGSMKQSRQSHYKQDRLTEHFVSGSTARTAASVNGGVKAGHSAAQKQATVRRIDLRIETRAAFSGGAVRRAGLPACRAGSPEKAFIYLRMA